MNFLAGHKITLVGIMLGAVGGYLYCHFIGCASGTCAITSKPLNSSLYGAIVGGLLFNMYKTKPKNMNNIGKMIGENKGTIVDVRTPAEFSGGHVAGSLNIPLQEIKSRIEEIKALKQPLVLCCASGGRSGLATQALTQEGMECYNGGSWLTVNSYVSQKN